MDQLEFDKSDVARIVKDYKEGWGMSDIGKDYGVSSGPIKRVLVRAGVKLRGPGRPKAEG